METQGGRKWLQVLLAIVVSVLLGVVAIIVSILSRFDAPTRMPHTLSEIIFGFLRIVLWVGALGALPVWVVYRNFRNRKVASVVLLALWPVVGVGVWFLGMFLLLTLLGLLD